MVRLLKIFHHFVPFLCTAYSENMQISSFRETFFYYCKIYFFYMYVLNTVYIYELLVFPSVYSVLTYHVNIGTWWVVIWPNTFFCINYYQISYNHSNYYKTINTDFVTFAFYFDKLLDWWVGGFFLFFFFFFFFFFFCNIQIGQSER